MYNLKIRNKKNELIVTETDWWLPEAGLGLREMDGDAPKVYTSSYRRNNSWDVMYSMVIA